MCSYNTFFYIYFKKPLITQIWWYLNTFCDVLGHLVDIWWHLGILGCACWILAMLIDSKWRLVTFWLPFWVSWIVLLTVFHWYGIEICLVYSQYDVGYTTYELCTNKFSLNYISNYNRNKRHKNETPLGLSKMSSQLTMVTLECFHVVMLGDAQWYLVTYDDNCDIFITFTRCLVILDIVPDEEGFTCLYMVKCKMLLGYH